MKFYEKLKKNSYAIQQQIVAAKKIKKANGLTEVKRLSKEFIFTAAILKSAMVLGRKKQ
jgi:hypothetical protein